MEIVKEKWDKCILTKINIIASLHIPRRTYQFFDGNGVLKTDIMNSIDVEVKKTFYMSDPDGKENTIYFIKNSK